MQYNDATVLNGAIYVTWDKSAKVLHILDSGGIADLATFDVTNGTITLLASSGTSQVSLSGSSITIGPTAPSGSPVINIGTGANSTINVGAAASGNTVKIASTFLSFFGATSASQQAANAALTNSTGGTPSTTLNDVTTLGLADPSKCNDNFASIAARLAEIRTLLVNYGLGT